MAKETSKPESGKGVLGGVGVIVVLIIMAASYFLGVDLLGFTTEEVGENGVDIEQGVDINIPGRYRNETFVSLQPYCLALKKKKGLHRIFPEKGLLFSAYSLAYLGYTETLQKVFKKLPNKLHEIQPADTIWQTNLLHYAIAGNHLETATFLIDPI